MFVSKTNFFEIVVFVKDKCNNVNIHNHLQNQLNLHTKQELMSSDATENDKFISINPDGLSCLEERNFLIELIEEYYLNGLK